MNCMKLKDVSTEIFFQRVAPTQVKEFQYCPMIIEAFYSEFPCGPFIKKIALSDQHLVIFEKQGEQYRPTRCKQINYDLKFRRLALLDEIKSKTPTSNGFQLITSDSERIRIYLQFEAHSNVWICHLASILNQIDFHEHYKIIEKIGKGSTSTVFKVLRIIDKKVFAAKAFLKSFLESKEQRKRSVLNEISLLRAMEHKNILKIQGVFQSNTIIFVVTEHLQGGTLIEKINKVGGFKVPQIKKIMKGIIEGLNYMHRFEIMHRDIKLQNIMFRSQDSLEVVIVDFGLAALTDDQPYIFYRCGTPGYIAPEIILMQENQKIETVCDVFSAGIIMHILLTNKYLFQGNNNQEVYASNKSISFDLNTPFYTQFDKSALSIMSQMLEIDCQQRLTCEQILSSSFFEEFDEPEKQGYSPQLTNTEEEFYEL